MSYSTSVTRASRVLVDWKDPKNVKRQGLHTPPGARLLAVSDSALAVSIPGYAENPGSRNSGLRSYYPANTKAYLILERLGETSAWCIQVLDWDNRQPRT